MDRKTAAALAGALIVASVPASAALFRCGNVFQDRPCESLEQQQVLTPGRPAPPAARPAPPPAATAVPVREDAAPAAKAAARPVDGPPSPICPNLREQHDALQARLQTARTAETRLMLQRQQREVESNMDGARCR